MRTIVDTSVWSIALRRRLQRLSLEQLRVRDELDALTFERSVVMIGPIRQELLTGISDATFFANVRRRLSAFSDEPLHQEDYERAAEFANRCRASGIAGSSTDFLICAAAYRHTASIFTTDLDFSRYATVLPVQLHTVRG